MKLARYAFAAVALCASVVIASCGDSSPLAPTAHSDVVRASGERPSTLLGGVLGGVTNSLLACSPLPAATVTQTVGPSGGTINIGPHKLVIPPGALSSNKTIKAVIKHENVNRVHFEPEGLQFAKPTVLTMSYANCGLVNSLLPLHRIAYTTSALQLLEHLLSLDDIFHKQVSAPIQHFSDYAVEEMSFSDHADWW